MLNHVAGRPSVETLATEMHGLFLDAIVFYVALGRAIQQISRDVSRRQSRRTSPRVGRNDPCTCGSGHKYKKCCGVSH